MDRVFLGLGSNLGDRDEYLRAGIRGLASRDIDIIRRASVYSTEPLEVVNQPWFLNTVIEIQTNLPPRDLLALCLEVEKENGRARDTAKGPRTLDIDVLFYGNAIIRDSALTIPHPNFSSRRFVLAPLAEIAPDFIDPVSGKNIRQILSDCSDPSVVLLAGQI